MDARTKEESSTPHERRRIAAAAEVCEKTVARYLRGEPVTALSRMRIERALRAMGEESEGGTR